jgi:hypothetical protein
MQVSMDMSDATELEQLLQFLAEWMEFDHDYLAPSLARYLCVEVEGCGPGTLVDDFSKFRFLLGAIGGEGVFALDER